REIGTRVWVSDPQITATCLDKRATYELCRDTEIRMPHSWFGELGPEATFPVIRKKILGSGSVGQRILRSRQEIPAHDDEYFCQALVKGVEYGMDILNDWEGRYVHSYYRRKLLMRAGETDKAQSLYSEQF